MTQTNEEITIHKANYTNKEDQKAIIQILNEYAKSPIGGGEELTEEVKNSLCQKLANHPLATSFIARTKQNQAIGLINTFEGFSTFKAKPLLNIHDVAITKEWQGKSIAALLLTACQNYAIERGCCKMTLEVLTGNQPALKSYTKFGFIPYELNPSDGQALLMQKYIN